MYDTPIPIINYVMVGITASVLAYATAMDVKDNKEQNNYVLSDLPANSDEIQSEYEIEGTKQGSDYERELATESNLPEADVRIANSSDNTEPVGEAMPVAGGKHNRKKHKKTTIRKNKQTNKKKHKQTRNNFSRK
jgi:hypothetical protein